MAQKYAFFPGCSLHMTAIEYGRSAEAACKALGVELEEIQDWVCCGATPTASYDYEISLGLGKKNLEKVEGSDLLVTPCSACFKNLKGAELHLKKRKSSVPQVRHLFQLVHDVIGLEKVKSKVKKPLKGLKVASYYGCLLTRVDPSFDSVENPRKMDEFTKALGGEPVQFPYKMKCCGGPIILSKHDAAVDLTKIILKSAKDAGADAVVVLCPMCGMMLDFYQKEALGKKDGGIPIVYFTQLMALAFGLKPTEVALDLNTVSTRPILKIVEGGGR